MWLSGRAPALHLLSSRPRPTCGRSRFRSPACPLFFSTQHRLLPLGAAALRAVETLLEDAVKLQGYFLLIHVAGYIQKEPSAVRSLPKRLSVQSVLSSLQVRAMVVKSSRQVVNNYKNHTGHSFGITSGAMLHSSPCMGLVAAVISSPVVWKNTYKLSYAMNPPVSFVATEVTVKCVPPSA